MHRAAVAIQVRRFASEEQCGIDGFGKSFTGRERIYGYVTVRATKKRINTPIVEMSSLRPGYLPI